VSQRPVSLLVANPAAKTGRAASAIEKALGLMTEARMHPEFFPTQPEGATVGALAERLEAGDIARVVYLGGDGTFADSAKGIILAREKYGIDPPLGMLPMGTANDQGRSFGVMAGEKNLARNIEVIAGGVEQWLDAARIEAVDERGELLAEDLWFDSCGFGLSASILAQRNRDRELIGKVPLLNRLYRDKLVYAGATFMRLFGSMVQGWRFSAEVKVDGEVHEVHECTDLIVKNTLLYGGDWMFAPDSKPDDGRVEVIVMASPMDWVSAAISGHKANPVTDDDREVIGIAGREIHSGKHLEIRIFRPEDLDAVPAQIDGEEFTSCDHYRIETLFHHLRILVPDDPHWA
jgi:diacylglycerol kinase family enzyme